MKLLDFIKKKRIKEKFPNCTEPLYVLIITDTHGHVRTENLNDFLSDITQIDVIFTLGDIEYRDFEIINNHPQLGKIKKYGLLGNHDYFSVLKDCGVESIHGQKIELNGISFTGMYGSIRYKSQNTPMFTDEESIQIATLLPDCDIFLTHDKAKVKEWDENKSRWSFAHSGMFGIGNYIKEQKPVYHIHGHLHENMQEEINGILSVGIGRYAYLKIDKSGMEIIKYFGPGFKKY